MLVTCARQRSGEDKGRAAGWARDEARAILRRKTMKITAIDPPGCGCTECLTGEYVPLDQAHSLQVAAMLLGKLANHLREGSMELRLGGGLVVAEWLDFPAWKRDEVVAILDSGLLA